VTITMVIDSNEHWRDYISGWQVSETVAKSTKAEIMTILINWASEKGEKQLTYHLTQAWCCKRAEDWKQIAGGVINNSKSCEMRTPCWLNISVG